MEHLKSFDSILDTGISGKEEKSNKKFKFKAMLAIGIMAGASAGLYIHNHSSLVNTETASQNSVVNTSIVDKTTPSIATPKNETILNTVYESNLINANNKNKIEQAGQFTLPNGLADNQIARKVAQAQYNSKNYYLSIVSEAEGFRSRIYGDLGTGGSKNEGGYAVGNGWNLSRQSKDTNNNLAKAISNNPEFIKKATSLSGVFSNASPAGFDFSITPQRSMQISELMGEKFEAGVINVLAKNLSKNSKATEMHNKTGKDYKEIAVDLLNSLEKNEKAAIVYHTYKVGEAGFSKYSSLINELINYSLSDNKNIENKKKVAETITYQYKVNGEIKKDTRAEVFVQSMFMDKEAFGFLIGKNVAPQHMKTSIPAINSNQIDVSVASEKVVIPDPVGDKLNEIEKSGKKVEMTLDYTGVNGQKNDLEQQNRYKRSHRFM